MQLLFGVVRMSLTPAFVLHSDRCHKILELLLTMLHPIQISCISSNWRGRVVLSLSEIHEIDLVHFLFPSDAEFCKDIASKYSVDFTANAKKRVAFFRKRIHRSLN